MNGKVEHDPFTLRAFLEIVVLSVGVLVLAWAASFMVGCSFLPETFEVCYIHPKFGQVCVSIDGKRVWKATLTPAERAEAEKWVDEQERGR